ncbi:MAG: CDP-glycerol glycerophosphotransferase family protein [Eubacterium sp.]|nr:CDP-glycerol glycerophosphotransferase family protein [Eubacterium sp.]
MYTIFNAAVASDDCEVYLLPLPRCTNECKELLWDTYTSVVEFCHQLYGGTVIDTYDFNSETYYDLNKLMPDYIFLNVPYTIQYPDVYSLEKMALIAKVCYVPYGYAMPNEKKYSDLYAGLFYVDLMKHISFLFVDGDVSYSYCKKNRMWLSEFLFGKRLFNIGYPRFDTIDAHEVRTIGNTILWLPRWTVANQIDDGNLASHFFDYNECLLRYVDGQDYYRLVIRPHPLMFENYIKYGLMSEQDVLTYKEIMKNNEKFFLNEKPSYDDAFNTADVLVADYSSTIIEFFLRGKPVIYCGKREELSPKIAYVTKTFYYVNGWEQLKKVLDDLKDGIDPLKEERQIAVEQFRAGMQDAGKTILNVLRKDYVSSKE